MPSVGITTVIIVVNSTFFPYILAVRKAGYLNIKTKMFDIEARVLVGWQATVFASQLIRTRGSKLNIFIFMLRWPAFLTAIIRIILLHIS